MIRATIRALSGLVDVSIDDRPLAVERLPRVHTMRERVRRWARSLQLGIHGLGPTPVTVSYSVFADTIHVEFADGRLDIPIGITKSKPFLYRGQLLQLRIFPIRGRLRLEAPDGRPVATGTYGLSRVSFTEYSRGLELLLATLAVGFALRVQWSEAAMVLAAPY